MSNNVSGEQQIPVTYTDLTSLDGFAWDRRSHRELTVTDRLVGFCLLVRREVMDQIGLLDEQFEIGCFEDDDFCRRAQSVGYRAVIANHVFVHHFGSVTFRGSNADFAGIMARNEQRYLSKWSSSSTQAHSKQIEYERPWNPQELADRYSLLRLDDGSQLLQRTDIRLSLCMIVRDNEDTIEACLDSIYPWVDEIIIVDTGSKDKTPEICRRFGARMFEFPWCDDFSAARNVSVEPARGEWIFWMDSDDVIPDEQGRKLRELVYGPHHPECFGYVMQVHCLSDEPGQMTVVDHVKVFRNLPDLRFEHRIHEQILPAIRRAGGTVAFTDLFVAHSGSRQDAQTRQRKLERDFRILKLDLERYPDHPFVLFNLGMTHEDAGQYAKAEVFLRRSIEVAAEGESHLRKAWALLVNCRRELGDLDGAVEAASAALELSPDDPELLFRRALARQESGALEPAIEDYHRVLHGPRTREFQSVDPGILGHKVFQNLAVIHEQLNELPTAVTWWRRAVNECLESPTAWNGLLRCLLRSGRLDDADMVVNEIPSLLHLQSVRSLTRSLCLEAQGLITEALAELERAWMEHDSTECLNELARILTDQQQFSASLTWLEQLCNVDPENPAVWHNLGQAHWLTGNEDVARKCLLQSLRIRPDSEVTRRLLQDVERIG